MATGSVSSGTVNNISLANTYFATGSNVFYGYCISQAGNYASASGTIIKTPPTPSMSGQVLSFADGNNYDGIDGRDLSVTWSTGSGIAFGSYFQSYAVYILPSGTVFNSGSQSPIAYVSTASIGSWTGTSSITKDSTNTTFASGSTYIAYVAIDSQSSVGDPGSSSAITLHGNTVTHPSVLSASFVGDTSLQVVTNATLDTTLANSSGSLFSYVYKGTTYTGTAISSVSAKTITVTIPSLG